MSNKPGREKTIQNPLPISVILDTPEMQIVKAAMQQRRMDRSPMIRTIIMEWAELTDTPLPSLTPTPHEAEIIKGK